MRLQFAFFIFQFAILNSRRPSVSLDFPIEHIWQYHFTPSGGRSPNILGTALGTVHVIDIAERAEPCKHIGKLFADVGAVICWR